MLFQLFLVDFFGSRLVGSVEHFLFFHILGIILLFDFHIFFRGVAPPPTSIYIYMITYGISPVVWNIPNYIYIYTCICKISDPEDPRDHRRPGRYRPFPSLDP